MLSAMGGVLLITLLLLAVIWAAGRACLGE
jgi:hypothetical protein